ncbi:uncharacterized protein LOC123227629 [Mangifera indica]|uniref:uncharacterized protein LOC123227629 n=1 Tax=Mangifera indica TaxID=29780 RepID=UPI001CFBC817|nr:uncharacterized protein LOC123227629 [Mangifera indica]
MFGSLAFSLLSPLFLEYIPAWLEMPGALLLQIVGAPSLFASTLRGRLASPCVLSLLAICCKSASKHVVDSEIPSQKPMAYQTRLALSFYWYIRFMLQMVMVKRRRILVSVRKGVQIRPIEEDIEVCEHGTTGLQGFEINLKAKEGADEKVESLGKRVLFLGHSSFTMGA